LFGLCGLIRIQFLQQDPILKFIPELEKKLGLERHNLQRDPMALLPAAPPTTNLVKKSVF
jgi:hypothetical protein